jgi:hypothetical protein
MLHCICTLTENELHIRHTHACVRKCRNSFCNGPGGTTKLPSWYSWLVLREHDLSGIDCQTHHSVHGDGSEWEPTGERQKRLRLTKDQARERRTSEKAEVIQRVIGSLGIGAKNQGNPAGAGVQHEAELKAAAISVQNAQASAIKASALQKMFESEAVPQCVKDAALKAWMKELGVLAPLPMTPE